MKIGIYGQFYHENSETYIELILTALQHNSVEIVIEKNFLEILSSHQEVSLKFSEENTFTTLDKSYDLFFSIGGDGTILKAITYVKDLGIPIVGINAGRLGFLATIQKEKITESINQILADKFVISERTVLSLETTPSNNEISQLNFALNEIAVNRKNTTSMIKVETMVTNK